MIPLTKSIAGGCLFTAFGNCLRWPERLTEASGTK